MILNNKNPIVVRRRKGTPDDPFVNITETHTVDPNAKVTLTEIPDRVYKVWVTAELGNWHEIEEGVLGATEFRVDYTNKLVTFHHSHIGKQFTFEYKGTGMEFIPTSMIYTKQVDGEVTQTLEDITEGASVVIEDAVIATNNANSKATLANEKANYAQEKGDYALETAEKVKTRWLTAVANYAAIATTYPSPSHGDTVQTLNDGKFYRREGNAWVFTQQITDTQIQNLAQTIQQDKTELLSEIETVNTQLAEKAQFSDVYSAYYARKNQEYLGVVSRKLRFGENVKIAFLGDSNSMRNDSVYQRSFLNNLNGVYNNRISRIDRAYPGDNAKNGYERFTTRHDADISVICYGTNDASDQYGFPDATKTKDYLYWMEQLITRELSWGKAVIIVSPIPVRNDKRWETKTNYFPTDPYPTVKRTDAVVLGNICEWLAEKYSAPFINSREMLSGYEDEIFHNGTGNSLGTATASFGDPVHLTEEGLSIWGTRVSSIFIGDSLLRKQKVSNGTAFATRKGEDPISVKADIFNTSLRRIKYLSTQHVWGTGDNTVGKRGFELQQSEEMSYSFYAETDDLIVYPNLFAFGSSVIIIKLDNGTRQPLPIIDEGLANGSDYGYQGNSTLVIDTNETGNQTFNITKGEEPSSKISNRVYINRGLRISSKGWHTINIKATNGSCIVSGLRFKSIEASRLSDLKTTVNNMVSAPNFNIIDLPSATDLNSITATGIYNAPGATNRPMNGNGLLRHFEKTLDNSVALQEYFPYSDTSKQWVRMKVAGAWQSWTQIK